MNSFAEDFELYSDVSEFLSLFDDDFDAISYELYIKNHQINIETSSQY